MDEVQERTQGRWVNHGRLGGGGQGIGVYRAEPDWSRWGNRPGDAERRARIEHLEAQGRAFVVKLYEKSLEGFDRRVITEIRIAREAQMDHGTPTHGVPDCAAEAVDVPVEGDLDTAYIASVKYTPLLSSPSQRNGDLWPRLCNHDLTLPWPGQGRPAMLLYRVRALLGLTLDWTRGLIDVERRMSPWMKSFKAHRDIKVANCLVDEITDADGTVRLVGKLADFGFALDESGRAPDDQTNTGADLGTFDYRSPQCVRNVKQVDLRDDVYSFGVLLVRLLRSQTNLAGYAPELALTRAFYEDGDGKQEQIARQENGTHVADLLAPLPRPAAAMAAVALHPNRGQRPDAEQFAALLDAIIRNPRALVRRGEFDPVDDGKLSFSTIPKGADPVRWGAFQATWTGSGHRSVDNQVQRQRLVLLAAELSAGKRLGPSSQTAVTLSNAQVKDIVDELAEDGHLLEDPDPNAPDDEEHAA